MVPVSGSSSVPEPPCNTIARDAFSGEVSTPQNAAIPLLPKLLLTHTVCFGQEFWAAKSAEWILVDFLNLRFSLTSPKQDLPTPTRVHLVSQNFRPLCLGVAVVVVFCFAAICWFYHGGGLLVGSGCQLYSGWHGGSHPLELFLASRLYFPKHLRLEVEAKAKTVVRQTLDLLGMGRSRSLEFNMCSQDGAKLLVKAWVELMQYLADVWVEAKTPLRGWKPRCDRAKA